MRFAQYKSDTNLQAAHAALPWIAVFDDHEVQNNWAGDHSDTGIPRGEFRARRAAAFQAYYEHLPLRRAQRPTGPDIRIHRRLVLGDLVDFHVLDTRQYRSPAHTMLGAPQKDWLFHNAHGNFVADVHADFDDPTSPVVATEFVGTSISSEGDGIDHPPGAAALLRANPHRKFDRVSRPQASVCVVASFELEAGCRGAQPR
ncbi:MULTISPECIES: alkaline phosphatase D family protein [Amycolatopsis]|uniref:PhoD-like phosphatase n=2 Tax=Amycolatopsis TaxID=1813 RepID=A0A1I3KC25_9PSEU|nr:alkaline phosphatase D family protein [Amycolatopsis sacchari]SFI69848.1 PhoD-like phosphatase [Amycolatopsis sacchari]